MKYTARQYQADLSRAQAALREAQRQDEMLCLELEQTDYPSLDSAAKARFTARFDASIAIILEGGIVQCVVTDKGLEGLPYEVIDYDTDGGDEADFYGIPQEDGSISTAYVSGGSVSTAAINLGGIKPLSDFDDEDKSEEG